MAPPHKSTVERSARATASPTRSGPEGSSRNEFRLGRVWPLTHPPRLPMSDAPLIFDWQLRAIDGICKSGWIAELEDLVIEKFGELEGRDVTRAVLSDGDVSVSILSYGAVTQDWRVPLDGIRVPVVLGFDKFEDYPKYSKSFGIIAGRVANRTALGRFEMDGVSYQLPINNGPNHLHGGLLGLGQRLWIMDVNGSKAVRLTYHSPDGEEGYPGAVDFIIDVSLNGNTLTYDMTGLPDRPTPINLAQHSYYSLGDESVLGHRLWMASNKYTPVDRSLIPTGEIVSVQDTHFDFRTEAEIGGLDPKRLGIDLNMVLDEARDGSEPAAIQTSPNGLKLRLWTDQLGIQVFNAPDMRIEVPGIDGQNYGPFAGLCLEAQKFPDSLNHPQFPSIICSPEEPYRQVLKVEIG